MDRLSVESIGDRRRLELTADCGNCFGLCCVVPAFSASSDFAIDKPAGQACPNLKSDSRCGIHTELRQRGFPGCTVYDCFGAGQKISQHTFGGQDWRADPATAAQMFEVFPIMRDLHELLFYLAEALTLAPIATVPPVGQGTTPTTQTRTPVGTGTTPTAQTGTPVGTGTTPTVQTGTPVGTGTTPTVQTGTPVGTGTTPTVQTGTPAEALRDQLIEAYQHTEELTGRAPESLREVDVAAHRQQVNLLLLTASELARSQAPPAGSGPAGPEVSRFRFRGTGVGGFRFRGTGLGGLRFRGTGVGGFRFRGTGVGGFRFRGTRGSRIRFRGTRVSRIRSSRTTARLEEARQGPGIQVDSPAGPSGPAGPSRRRSDRGRPVRCRPTSGQPARCLPDRREPASGRPALGRPDRR